jgi:pyruvate carboxylase subunit B
MVKSQFPELSKEDIANFGQPAAPRHVAPSIPTEYNIEVNGEPFEVKLEPIGGFISIEGAGLSGAVAMDTTSKPPKDTVGGIKSSMQGTILKVPVNKGDDVDEGKIIVVIEAMKMENEIPSPHGGKVQDIFIKEGDTVNPGDVIMVVK